MRLPAGYAADTSARLTVGPPTSIGSVGAFPADGPGSKLFAGNSATNESEKVPAVRIAEMSSKCVLS